MISPLTTLIVIVFAATQVVEIIHHGSVFGPKGHLPLRPRAKKWAEGKNFPLKFLGQLISCPFCLSPWVCTTLAFSWYFGGITVKLVIAGFAITRGANILNDLTHGITRSPDTAEESTETNAATESTDPTETKIPLELTEDVESLIGDEIHSDSDPHHIDPTS